MSSARMPPSLICARCAEKIEAVLLIRTQFRLQDFRQIDGRNALEIADAFAQRLRLRRIRKARQAVLVQMRDVFQADAFAARR